MATVKSPQQPATPPKAGPGARLPPRRSWLIFAIVLLINYFLVQSLFPGPGAPLTIPYTTFKEQVSKGNVASIYSRGSSLEGKLKAAITWPTDEQAAKAEAPIGGIAPKPRTGETFLTEVPSFVDPGLEAFLIQHGVEISAVSIREGSGWATLLFGFGPAILIIAFYVWLYRRAQQSGGMGGLGGIMGIGRSKARRYDTDDTNRVTFNDVAGIDEAENELVEIVDFLKSPDKYTRLGGTAPKGVLLIGAPGTGISTSACAQR